MNANAIEFVCPFCGGHCHAGQVAPDGGSGILHTRPICETYDKLDVLAFMQAVNARVREDRGAMAKAFIGALRCVVCERAPTEKDASGMLESFGDQIKPGDTFVWKCMACMMKGAAEA